MHQKNEMLLRRKEHIFNTQKLMDHRTEKPLNVQNLLLKYSFAHNKFKSLKIFQLENIST
jgi:hypothetical protein